LRTSQRAPLALFAASTLVCNLLGCAAEVGPPRNLPPPVETTAVGPDDLFDVDVVGEKDLSHSYQVHPDGTIDFDHGLKVDGLEPQQVAQLIRKRLIDGKILADPQVSIIVRQYNSRKVLVIGAVQKPDSLTWTPGMTLVGAISLCGWFTPLADKGHVTIIRKVGLDKSVQAVVSVEAITRHAQEDVRLQAGDTINVAQNVF
jgi:polysaccharide export outer membrane protein